jgi:hypothetical protein
VASSSLERRFCGLSQLTDYDGHSLTMLSRIAWALKSETHGDDERSGQLNGGVIFILYNQLELLDRKGISAARTSECP